MPNFAVKLDTAVTVPYWSIDSIGRSIWVALPNAGVEVITGAASPTTPGRVGVGVVVNETTRPLESTDNDIDLFTVSYVPATTPEALRTRLIAAGCVLPAPS